MRIIKRYQTGKLYDTEQSCYVTLSEVGEIMQNTSTKVIDNKSKTDITYQTQLQILFDKEKKHSIMDKRTVGNVISLGTTLTQRIRSLEIDLGIIKWHLKQFI